ncbi:hypothetical protein BC835DRAFT_1415518 [Cytidiella melzeri]|nr:hypothetical protein BC835DRAFT_1415518 [Cytidiella melzeri]
MTVTILASLSLLALVVTARPLLPTSDETHINGPSPDAQYAIQLAFQSRIGQPARCFGPSCEDDDNVQIHVTSVQELTSVLAELEGQEDIKAIVPLEPSQTEAKDDARHYDFLMGHDFKTTGTLQDPGDAATPPPPVVAGNSQDSLQLAEPEHEPQNIQVTEVSSANLPLHEFGSPRIVVLTLACVVAFVSLGCVISLLYLKRLLDVYLCKAMVGWNTLPRFKKQAMLVDVCYDDNFDGSTGDKQAPFHDPVPVQERDGAVVSMDDDNFNKEDDGSPGKPTVDERQQEMDEVFHDAEGTLIELSQPDALAAIMNAVSDPDDLPLPISLTPFSTPPPSPPRTPLHRAFQMREVSPSSVTRPAWSLRATDAPALGMSGSAPAAPLPIPGRRKDAAITIPGAFSVDDNEQAVSEHKTGRRAYRDPVPQLDIAFAMQLRPGLGMGSDPAWLVRFLMAMFGWMTVLLGGNNLNVRTQQRRALPS